MHLDRLHLWIYIQLTLPTAFDEAGLKMLDSIREIFDILDIDFEAVRFNWIKYNNEKGLIDAIGNAIINHSTDSREIKGKITAYISECSSDPYFVQS